MKNKIVFFWVWSLYFFASCDGGLYVSKEHRKSLTNQQKSWLKKQMNYWVHSAPRGFDQVGRSWSTYILSPVFKGYIVTTSNDTLRGLIKSWPLLKVSGSFKSDTFRYYIALLPDGKKITEGITPVDIREVNYFRLYDLDSIPNNDRFTDIANLTSIDLGSARSSVGGITDYPSLWRMDDKLGNVGIYDNDQFFWFNTIYKGKMLLVENNKATSMYSWWSYLWHDKTTLLLKYINRNYNQHFDKGYFKDEKEEIDYILNKENEIKVRMF